MRRGGRYLGIERKGDSRVDSRFDVILCDLMMGDMSGIELYRWLSENQPRVAARMVFMTGGAYTSAAREFVDTTPARFIDKPLVQAKIEGAIQGVAREQGSIAD
jgi:DNA-binding NarL/FixJ family response regulator